MTNTNFKLLITNVGFWFRSSLFFCLLFLFSLNIFGQNLETLAQMLERGNVEQKRDALLQIRNLETAESSRVAIPGLKDSSEIVRATAASSIVFLPKNEAAQILIPLLSDKKPFVRREAAYALGKVRNSSAINSLIQTFQKDKILEVKSACVVALGEIGDASAIDFLTQILRRKPQTKEEFIQRSAARSIGQIAQIIQTGDATVLTPENVSSAKIETLQNYQPLIKTFPQFVPAIEVLIQTLKDSEEFTDVKREAAFALGAIGDESAIPVLQNLANSDDYYLAAIARQSLEKISAHSD